MTKNLLVWLKDCGKEEKEIVGGENIKLSSLIESGFPIVPGFVVTSLFFRDFLKVNNFDLKIRHLLGPIDFEDASSIEKGSDAIKKLLMKGTLSENLVNGVFKYYFALGGVFKNPSVDITSEIIGINSIKFSSNMTQNIQGEANLIFAIKEAWARLFNPKNLIENNKDNQSQLDATIVIRIQKSLNPEVSGTFSALDYYTADKSNCTITSTFGLIHPQSILDVYIVKKSSLEILQKDIIPQKRKINIKKGIEEQVDVPTNKHSIQKISDANIKQLASLCKKLENEFYLPQDGYWYIENNKLYISKIHETIVSFKRKNAQTIISQTATKILISSSGNEDSSTLASQFVDGIGVLNLERIYKQNHHPKKLLQDENHHAFVDTLANSISNYCKSFSPRPVIYQLTDLTSNDYRRLKHGNLFESLESNPEMGYHGAYRHIHDTDMLELEISAVKKVRNKMGSKNLWLLLPYVRTVKEFSDMKKVISSLGLYRSASFKILLSIDTPANSILIEDYLSEGIDGVNINLDSLFRLTLGVDKNNSEMSHAFSEEDPAILWEIERIVTSCKKKSVPVTFHSLTEISQTLLEKLIKYGITSITVSPEKSLLIREDISRIEKEIWQK